MAEIYELCVFDSDSSDEDAKRPTYAFATFYSQRECADVRKALTGRLVINGKLADVR